MPARPPRRQRQAGDVLTDTCLRETPLGFGSRVRCPRDLLSMILQQRRHATAFLVISRILAFTRCDTCQLVPCHSCCHFDLILAAPAT